MQMKIVKKQILRVVALVMALCLIAVSFTGCGKAAVKNPYKTYGEKILESQVLAYNDNYELAWDHDAKAVLYKHKSGEYWSDIFYDAYLDGSIGNNGSSPISIKVINNKTLDLVESSSTSALEGTYETDNGEFKPSGYMFSGKIDGGIRVYYFFEMYKIAVPVDYVLKDDHIEISVDSSAIMEDGTDYKLVSIYFMSNFCGIKNSKDANLLVPTGNGAIMNCAENAEGAREYEGNIYGKDITIRTPLDKKDDEAINLPVFGSYNKDKGLLAIIESAIGSATLHAEASNDRTNHSTIYPEFYVRGYDSFMKEYYGQNIWGATQRYNDNISGQTFKVSYYPLFGEDADYNGMAKKYQSYLVEKGELKKSNVESSAPYSVTFLGGTNTTKSFFGIPYKKIAPLTTFEEAKNILEKIKTNIGVLPQVRLLGYSDNGLRPGSIAGGSSYPSVYGSKKELKSLIDYCKGTNLFLDFDIVTYSKSGNGFSMGDVAETAVGYEAEIYPTTPVRRQDAENKYFALGREHLIDAGEAALDKADKYSAKAISLSTLGKYAYSDYNDEGYINRYQIEKDAKSILDSAKKAGYVTAVSGANSYAASNADVIFDVPITSGEYDAFTYDVPFYQMVFSSYKSMYTPAINNEVNVEEAIAKSIAYGMGVNYFITNNYVDKSDDLDEYKLYATLYEDNSSKMKNVLVNNGFINTYNAVKGASLDSYVLSGAIAKSVYSNGTVVYTNLSAKSAKSPVGVLKPYEYKIG